MLLPRKFILLLHCSLQSLQLSTEWKTCTPVNCFAGESRGLDQLLGTYRIPSRLCTEVTEIQSHILFPFSSGKTVFPLAKGLKGCERESISNALQRWLSKSSDR